MEQEIRNEAAGAAEPGHRDGKRRSGGRAPAAQSIFSHLNIMENQAAGMQGKCGEMRGELEANKELLKAVDKMEVPSADLDALIHSDQVADQLNRQVAGLKMELEQMRRR